MKTPNPFEPCPDCGAPAHIGHLETCQWNYTNLRSKLPANKRETLMRETPEPDPVPVPDEPDPDDGDEGATVDQ